MPRVNNVNFHESKLPLQLTKCIDKERIMAWLSMPLLSIEGKKTRSDINMVITKFLYLR